MTEVSRSRVSQFLTNGLKVLAGVLTNGLKVLAGVLTFLYSILLVLYAALHPRVFLELFFNVLPGDVPDLKDVLGWLLLSVPGSWLLFSAFVGWTVFRKSSTGVAAGLATISVILIFVLIALSI
jgi:hypothetical protein